MLHLSQHLQSILVACPVVSSVPPVFDMLLTSIVSFILILVIYAIVCNCYVYINYFI
jgi:hypothetical protein